MTASLVVLLPVILFAIVTLTCFVGCAAVLGVDEVVYTDQYQNTVTTTNGLVAFWPLNDTSGTKAVDLGHNHFDGTYIGFVALHQTAIVAGDPSACALFDGGHVQVDWQAALGPPQFTIEAWVKAEWTLADVQTDPSAKVIVASASVQPSAVKGFALFASPDQTSGNTFWTAQVGVGTAQPLTARTGNNHPIVPGSLYFLVMTYDGGAGTLNLWVNPADTSQGSDATASGTGFVPVPSPIPFYIGIGRPDLPAAIYPFKGSIQDVAFYNVVLDNKTIETHYLNGSGMAKK